MKTSLDARIEVARGEMVIGDVVVPLAPAGAAGEWQLGGTGGPTLRPLHFGERTRLAALAATSLEPCASLGAAIARAATVADGELAPLIREAAALLLCGARNPGPSFGETALCVARAAGWDLAQISDADSTEIDRLASSLGARPQQASWRRLVLAGADPNASLTTLRDHLAENLLARVEEAGDSNLDRPERFEGVDTPRSDAPVGSPAPPDAGSSPATLPREAGHYTVPLDVTLGSVSQPRTGSAIPEHVWPGNQRAATLDAAAPTRGRGDSHERQWPVSHAAHAREDLQSPGRGAAAAPLDRLGFGAVVGGGSPLRAPRPSPFASVRISNTALGATPTPAERPSADLDLETQAPDIADAIAALLDDESDLRGLE